MSAVVKFARIGRTHEVADLPIEGDSTDWDVVAEQVWNYARRFLLSRDFLVTVSQDGVVWIDGGRFGEGQLVEDAAS